MQSMSCDDEPFGPEQSKKTKERRSVDDGSKTIINHSIFYIRLQKLERVQQYSIYI